MKLMLRAAVLCLIAFHFSSPLSAIEFTPLPPSLPQVWSGSLAWGDYDNDDDLDLLLSGFGDTGFIIRLYENKREAGFVDTQFAFFASQFHSAKWTDYNNDGRLDLFLSGSGNSSFPDILLRGLPNNTFEEVAVPFSISRDETFFSWVDLNNDGRIDLVGSADTLAGNPRLLLYQNLGGGQLTVAQASFPQAAKILLACGDYDKDGDIDLLASGHPELDAESVFLLRNDGAFQFVDSQIVIPPMAGATAAFIDFNHDGLLDIHMSGYNSFQPKSWLLRNEGQGQFVASSGIPAIGLASFAWADYDNDGDVDAMFNGYTEGFVPDAMFALNLGNDAFEIQKPISPLIAGVYAAGDFDNDGRIDLAASGVPNVNGPPLLLLYQNAGAPSNHPPSAPATLTSQITSDGVMLSWAASQDPEQSGGLTYNLRVGSSPGKSDVYSSLSNPLTGFRQVPAPGNTGPSLSWSLKLPSGVYYWAVQAVDSAYSGSPFSTESSFVVPARSPFVSLLPVSDNFLAKATVNGLVHPNSSATVAYFEYGLSANYDSRTAPIEISEANNSLTVSNLLTGLAIEQTYHYRLVASNAFGVTASPHSVFIVTNTLPQITVPARVNLYPGQSIIIPFSIQDNETIADKLQVTARSGNTNVFPPELFVLRGTGENRELVVTASSTNARTFIQIEVKDEHGGSSIRGFPANSEYFSITNINAMVFAFNGSPILADFNNDGKLDILSNTDGIGLLNLHESGLSYKRVSQPLSGLHSLSDPADFNNDGILDIFAVNGSANNLNILLGDGAGKLAFSGKTNIPFFPNVRGYPLDFNNDGQVDIAILNERQFDAPRFLAPTLYSTRKGTNLFRLGPIMNTINTYAISPGDFNNDGSSDILVVGSTSFSNFETAANFSKILWNDGGGNFSTSKFSLPNLISRSLAVGDFNNDGLLDVVASGRTNSRPSFIARTYLNTGNDGFIAVDAEFAADDFRLMKTADMDNDGLLDLIVAGERGGAILRGDGAGHFSQLSQLFRQLQVFSVASFDVGDVDNDGDLDVLLSESGGSRPAVAFNNHYIPNNPPLPPASLGSNMHMDSVTLSWNTAVDADQTGGLSYNVRVGTSPGGIDIVSPLAHPVTGKRLVPRLGNAGLTTFFNLRHLAPGQYYWSVQSLDHNYAGSPFAAEATFIVPPRISTFHVSPNAILQLQVLVSGPGQYTLESTEDFQNWDHVTQKTASSNTVNFEIPLPSSRQKFYRLRGP